MENESELEIYIIPKNVIRSRKFFGFPKRNWAEGIIEALLLGYLISYIHFVIKVKIIVIIVLCGAVLFGNLIGVKNRSITQIIKAFIWHQKNKALYHLGSVTNYEKRERLQTGSVEGESAAEKAFFFIKHKIKSFTEGIDDDDIQAD